MSEVLAYLRKSKEGLAQGVLERWELTNSTHDTMEADHDDLLFAEEMDQEDVILHFEAKYPVERPGMTRITTGNGYSHPFHGRPMPKEIYIYAYEWYDRGNAEEICHMAAETPGQGVIYKVGVSSYDYSKQWEEHTQVWNSQKQAYEFQPSPLEQYDCYQRLATVDLPLIGETRVREVVYNPKVIARRQKTRAKKAKEGGTIVRKKGSLLTSDFDVVTRGLTKLLQDDHGLLKKPDGWNSRRHGCMWDFRNAIRLVCMVYDRTAHRQCDEFQKLLAEWRERREETIKFWSGGEDTYTQFGDIWKFLDEEAKKRKPKKRKLKVARKINLPL